MTTRRTFILASAALGGAGMMGSARAAYTALGTYHPHRVVFDTRFAESRMFGEEAGRSGYETRAMEGDVGMLWRTDLSRLLREAPVPIAGMTAPDALFCFEQFARGTGLELVLRIDHRVDGDGNVTHAHGGDLPDLAAIARDFPVQALRAVDTCRRDASPLGLTCLPPQRSGEAHRLVTWMFAPRARSEEFA